MHARTQTNSISIENFPFDILSEIGRENKKNIRFDSNHE